MQHATDETAPLIRDDDHASTRARIGAPRLSVVTVCLNDLEGLRVTHDSVRSQSVAPHQWIVADGGSTDGTLDWLESNDWRNLSWTSECDGGIYFGMNRGLRRVTGEYVLFLNSGDALCDPYTLSHVANKLDGTHPLPSLVFGDCMEVDADGVSWHRTAHSADWVPIGMPTSHQAMCFRLDAIIGGYDTEYRLSSDYALIMSLYKSSRGNDFEYISVPICRFRLGGRSEANRSKALIEDADIRRKILGMGALPRGVLHILHGTHALIKRYVPVLHRAFRYE